MFVWDQAPVGAWQQTGYLLAGLALERVHRTPRPDPDSFFFTADRDDAEAQLRDAWAAGSVFTLARALAQAVVWRGNSAVASAMLPVLIAHFRAEYGLHIDSTAMAITLDIGFDAARRLSARKAFLDTARALCVQYSAVRMLEAAGMAWEQAERVGADLAAAEPDRRGAVLDAAGLATRTRAELIFVADYLTDRLGDSDLAATPVLVELATEAREHIQSQIFDTHYFPPPGQRELLVKWSTYDRDAALLSAEDRALLDAVAMRPHDSGVGPAPVIWPGITGRFELEQMLHQHAEAARELRTYAAALAADPGAPIDLARHTRITDVFDATVATIGVAAESARHGTGLLDVERNHTLLSIAATDLGLPEPRLAFVGELHKWRTDVSVTNQRAGQLLAQQCLHELTDTLHAVHGVGLAVEPSGSDRPVVTAHRLRQIRTSLEKQARWDTDPDRARALHHDEARHLDRDLSFSGASFMARADARAVLDRYAERAGDLAEHARDRDYVWTVRLSQITIPQAGHGQVMTATGLAITAALPEPGTASIESPSAPLAPPSPEPPTPETGPQL